MVQLRYQQSSRRLSLEHQYNTQTEVAGRAHLSPNRATRKRHDPEQEFWLAMHTFSRNSGVCLFRRFWRQEVPCLPRSFHKTLRTPAVGAGKNAKLLAISGAARFARVRCIAISGGRCVNKLHRAFR